MPLVNELLPNVVRWGVKLVTVYVTNKIAHPPLEEPGYLKRSIGAAVSVDTTEVRIIQSHIENARLSWDAGDKETAQKELSAAIGVSHCDRCKRGMERVLTGKNVDGNLNALKKMIPAYYQIMQDEDSAKLKTIVSRDLHEEKKESVQEKSEQIIANSCKTCAASEVLRICNFEEKCMQEVLKWIDEQKKAGNTVLEADLLAKAKEYGGGKND